jgi:hypothetical protein
MDDEKFDHLSRSLVVRADRRQALRTAGAGGVLGAVAGAFGLRRASASAITDPVDCTMPLIAKVAVGKNKGKRYAGDLAITIETNGAIDTGQLTTSDGKTYDVVGQADGRSINLRITIASDQFLSLIGTGQQDLNLCKGRVDGTFGGWAESDLGTWTLGVKPASSSPQATIGSGNGGGSNSSGGSSNGGGNSGGTNSGGGGSADNPTPTPTPCPPQDCGGGAFVWLPDQCACGCPPPDEKCGDTMCCPGGSICDAANNSCGCPADSVVCNEVCTPSICAAGSSFSYDSCQCETATSCGAGETLCASSGTCVSTSCPANQLFDGTQCMCVNRCDSGQDFCGGACISITTNDNCGSCGNVCPAGQSCYGSYCDCPPDYTYNPTKGMCFPPCTVACTNGTTCVDGVCKA